MAARTQEQRRAQTRARLVDAAIETMVEHGYAGTTAKNVLARAGVSAGGLYRHFPSMLDLVIAAAEEVRERQFTEFRLGLEQLADLREERCIELLRAACRRPMNAAWYELIGAARTDVNLREQLQPFAERYHQQIVEFARDLPVADRWVPDAYAMAIFSIIHLLDGEAMTAVVHDQSEMEDARTAMLAALLRGDRVPGGPGGSDGPG